MAEKVRMPASTGGLVRYFDDYKSKLEFSPKIVVGAIVVVIVLALYLHNFRPLG